MTGGIMQARVTKRYTSVCVMVLLLLLFCLPAKSWSSEISTEYDKYFQKYQRALPVGTDWRLLKAQCYQESRLQPHAKSPVGAMGLCQFMPNTWREVAVKHELNNPWRADQSIRAAAIYMTTLHGGWSSPRPPQDRYLLALASYNAGFGNLLAAQRKCDMAVLYSEIIPCLEAVTGYHSAETRGYVSQIIGRWYPLLLTGGY